MTYKMYNNVISGSRLFHYYKHLLMTSGQKEVLTKIAQLSDDMQGMKLEFRNDFRALDGKIDTVYRGLKTEINVTALALKDQIDRVETKLDAHMREPAHA